MAEEENTAVDKLVQTLKQKAYHSGSYSADDIVDALAVYKLPSNSEDLLELAQFASRKVTKPLDTYYDKEFTESKAWLDLLDQINEKASEKGDNEFVQKISNIKTRTEEQFEDYKVKEKKAIKKSDRAETRGCLLVFGIPLVIIIALLIWIVVSVKSCVQKNAPKVTQAVSSVLSDLGDSVSKSLSSLKNVIVEETERGVKLSIQSLNFKPDSDELVQEDLNRVYEIAGVLKTIPNKNFLVEGHTAKLNNDDSGDYELSLRRAKFVANKLIETGISADRFKVEGCGSKVPIADNGTAEGRAKNRRVEITILKK